MVERSMAGSITGLRLFITRIKGCTNSSEEEQNVEQEMAKVRQYFANKGLTGYDRKKCIWKIIFVGVLGYNPNIGHTEVLHLISSPKFDEKITGYTALTIIYDETYTELIDMAVNAIKGDLTTGHEYIQAVALTAIANFPAKQFMDKLTEQVCNMAFGMAGNTFYVQKRALMCLATFLKKNPALYQEAWATYYRSLLQAKSIGILLATITLIFVSVQHFGPTRFLSLIEHIVGVTRRLQDGTFPTEYNYNLTMCPWLQVKVLSLLQQFPPPEKPDVQGTINAILVKIVERSRMSANVNTQNAHHAVLFEAINLALHYRTAASHHLRQSIVTLLSRYIRLREPNIRYLALEATAKLDNASDANAILTTHKSVVLLSLKDPDLSIRKRALDVLFALCTRETAVGVVNELLDYLKERGSALKEELILKVALLAEKYGENMLWYIDVILKILALAGNYVGDDVWYRISQIVTGFGGGFETTPETQRYAVVRLLGALNTAHCHEPLIKLSAYVLGEYGDLIADPSNLSEGSRGLMKQYEVLTRHYTSGSPMCRCMILNTLAKFAGKCSAMKECVISFLENCQSHWDLDIQQRAAEYLTLITATDFEARKGEILVKLPAFPASFFSNNILHRSLEHMKQRRVVPLNSKGQHPVPAQTQQQQQHPAQTQTQTQLQTGTSSVMKIPQPSREEVARALEAELAKPSHTVPVSKPAPQYNEATLAQEYQTMSIGTDQTRHPIYAKYMYKFAPEPSVDPTQAIKLGLPPTNGELWKKLISTRVKEGVIFDHEVLSIELKADYVRFTARLLLKFLTKGPPLENMVGEVSAAPGLIVQCSKVKYSKDKEPPMLMMRLMLAQPFDQAPVFSLSFTCAQAQHSLQFGLPMLLSKFVEPGELRQDRFDALWNDFTVNKPPTFGKMDVLLKNPAPRHITHMDVLKRMASLFYEYFGLYVIPPADQTQFTVICAAGQVVFKSPEQLRFPESLQEILAPIAVPLLIQAEFYPEVTLNEFRFSIRAGEGQPITLPILSLFKFFVNPNT